MQTRKVIGPRQDMNTVGQAAVNAETFSFRTIFARFWNHSGVKEPGMCEETSLSTGEASMFQQDVVGSEGG